MVFSSLIFLFAFFAMTLLLYYIFPSRKWKNIVLFFTSLLFYAWGEPVYILVMLASITSAYVCGLLIAKHLDGNKKKARMYMILSLSLNLAALVFFKYWNFLIGNLRLIPQFSSLPIIEGLVLPIGISFYTFQIMSYTIDLYWGRTGVQRSFIAFGTYVTLFPQLIAGPIVRYRDVDDQLMSRRENIGLFAEGVRRFIAGVAKKVLLGDAAAAIYEYCRSSAGFEKTSLGAWMVMIFYTFHIYFDFSGYSDMAIGLGKMFGFRFLENFDYPYISASITEFWRRWHMSLSTWFKEYVYIPLGGNRLGLLKQYRNIAIVWLLTGLWHGASWNFVLWGVYFGAILMLEKTFLLKLLEKLPKFLRHLYALLLIGFGWIIFSFTNLSEGISEFTALFGINVDSFTTPVITYQFLRTLPFLAILCIASTPYPKKLYGKLLKIRLLPNGDMEYHPDNKDKVSQIFAVIMDVACIAVFIICVAYLVDSTFSPFLYFNF